VNAPSKSFVPVASALNNLRRLELAVSDNLPVLLEGPIGCGKTTLVEHLAEVMGRTGSQQLMKLQLGDQMDSKVTFSVFSQLFH
jgi:midasin